MRSHHKGLALLVLIVVASALPFLQKPFNIDDSFYMDMARNAQINPFFPNDIPYVFQGRLSPDMGSHSHPLLQTYFLALVLHFIGEGPGREWIYHLLALIYPITAVVSFYFICLRFVARPLWPAILLACSPLFLVIQHTLMTDLPMLAFWLGAVCCFIWAVEKKSSGLYLASAAFQSAALFTSYQSLALLPLLGFYQLRKGQTGRGWVSLAVAPVVVGAWYAVSCFHYRRMLFGMTWDYIRSRDPFSPQKIAVKLMSVLEYQGWLLIFPFFIYCVLGRRMKKRTVMLFWLGAACLTQWAVPEYRWIDKGIFLAGLVAGVFVLGAMGGEAYGAFRLRKQGSGGDKTDDRFIALWYFGVFFYCVFILTDGAARYILPLAPPFFICFFRYLETSEVIEYRIAPRLLNSAKLAGGSVVLSLAWGLALSCADQEFAGIYPRAASDFSRIVGKARSYCVGEWGFRYYFGQAGARPLPVDVSAVQVGDFIAIPRMALPHEVPMTLMSRSTIVERLEYRPSCTLRIFDWKSPAAFYASEWGLIPFSFSWGNLEEIEIRRIGP